MPKLRGGELLGLCKRSKSLCEIPFFIITSQVSVERAKVMHAAHLDVDQYLLKPFGSAELKERIDRVLEKKRVAKEVSELAEKGFEELEQGHSKAAFLKFQKALKLNPDFDMGISGLGDAVFRTNNVDAAIPYYQKALAINPGMEMHYK